MPTRETLEIVFKSGLKRLPATELIDAIATLINTNCGEIYAGVEDDGTLTGVHKTQSNAGPRQQSRASY